MSPLRPDGLPSWWTQLEQDAAAVPISRSPGHGFGVGLTIASGVRERSKNARKREYTPDARVSNLHFRGLRHVSP